MKPEAAYHAARKQDPLRAPWGLFISNERIGQAMLWFEDRDALHAFVEGTLWSALSGVEPPEEARRELEDLLGERPPLSWNLLEPLNLILEPVTQLHWWGTLAQLHDGEDPFAKDLREAYRDEAGLGPQDFSKLSSEQRTAFAGFVRGLWQGEASA